MPRLGTGGRVPLVLGAVALLLATSLPGWRGPVVVAQTPDDGLPPGRGREILRRSCTPCHAVTEITKFKGYYTRAQWRDVVNTMVEYGTAIAPPDAEALADYLFEHLGKR